MTVGHFRTVPNVPQKFQKEGGFRKYAYFGDIMSLNMHLAT